MYMARITTTTDKTTITAINPIVTGLIASDADGVLCCTTSVFANEELSSTALEAAVFKPQTIPSVDEVIASHVEAGFAFNQQFDGGVHAKWVHCPLAWHAGPQSAPAV